MFTWVRQQPSWLLMLTILATSSSYIGYLLTLAVFANEYALGSCYAGAYSRAIWSRASWLKLLSLRFSYFAPEYDNLSTSSSYVTYLLMLAVFAEVHQLPLPHNLEPAL